MGSPPNSQDAIVDAAEAVVLEGGAAHMTLAAVAAKAGVSKGGLLYHFPTKETLLKAMLDRRVQRYEELRKKKYAELAAEPARAVKAYILSTLDRDRKMDRIGAAILAAVAHDPSLLEPTRHDYQRRLAKLAPSGIRPERAAVIALAADGLRLLEILSLSPLEDGQRKEVIAEMLRLAADEGQKATECRHPGRKALRRKSGQGSRKQGGAGNGMQGMGR